MIVKHHMLENLYKKSELKTINFKPTLEAAKLLRKVAKKFKISESAIVAVCLEDYANEELSRT